MRYEIDNETYAISIYDDINSEPFWYQPDYPNLDKFDSYEEAEEWAKIAIASYDDSYGFLPPDGKNTGLKPKPTEQEKLEAKLNATGLTVDDLKTLLGL